MCCSQPWLLSISFQYTFPSPTLFLPPTRCSYKYNATPGNSSQPTNNDQNHSMVIQNPSFSPFLWKKSSGGRLRVTGRWHVKCGFGWWPTQPSKDLRMVTGNRFYTIPAFHDTMTIKQAMRNLLPAVYFPTISLLQLSLLNGIFLSNVASNFSFKGLVSVRCVWMDSVGVGCVLWP